MAINLSNYIESILNPNERFRTLEGIYALRGKDGEAMMTVTEMTVDFKMIYNDEHYTLKCLFKSDNELASTLKDISVYTSRIDCSFLSPHIYLQKEMLVFNNAGQPEYADIIIQKKPDGKRLDQYLADAAGKGRKDDIKCIISGLAEMAEWLASNEFSHGNICSKNIYICANYTPVLVNYTHSLRRRSQQDLRYLGALIAAVYITACKPELYSYIIHDRIAKIGGLRKLILLIADIMSDEDTEELKELLSLVLSSDATDQDIGYAIERIVDLNPRSYKALEHIAMHFNNRKTATDNNDKPAKYSFIGGMHDMVMRVFDGDVWFYIDKNGNLALPGHFIGAEDFSEGRAIVETEQGYGMIDLEGNFIIEPCCEDIEWDSIHNVAIVTTDGQSGLYDRNGGNITGLIYDQILNGSEGLFPIKKNGRFGFIAKNGRMVIKPQFDDAFGFRNGVARVRVGNREFLIDISNSLIDDIKMEVVKESVK